MHIFLGGFYFLVWCWEKIVDAITGSLTEFANLIGYGIENGLHGMMRCVDWMWDAFFPQWTNPPTLLRYTVFPLFIFWTLSQFILMMIRLFS